MSKKRQSCPKCQSKKIVPIRYGMPTSEMYEESKLDKFVLGGCIFSDDSPKWHCQDCGHEFGKLFDMEAPELPLPDDIKPLKLEFTIGGFTGSNHRVKLESGKLMYQFSDIPLSWSQIESSEITPTERKWVNFKKELDAMVIWKWKKRYVNRDVCDGTQWELEIDYGISKIKVYGDNKYPGSTDQTDSRETSEFKAFLHALNLLLGGVKIA